MNAPVARRVRTLALGSVLAFLLFGSETIRAQHRAESEAVERVRSSCPTFTWSPSRQSRELTINRFFANSDEREIVFSASVPAGSSSFTLPADHCLESGSYSWRLRAAPGAAAVPAAGGREAVMFEVPHSVVVAESERLVQRYLASGGELDAELIASVRARISGVQPRGLADVAELHGESDFASGAHSGLVAVTQSQAGAGAVVHHSNGIDMALSGSGLVRSEAEGGLRLKSKRNLNFWGNSLKIKFDGSTIFEVDSDGNIFADSFIGDGQGMKAPAIDLQCSGCLGGLQIQDGTLRSADMSSLLGPKLAGDVASPRTVANGAITAAKISFNSIGLNQIASDAANSSEIANGAVGTSEIATGAVGSSELASGSIRAEDLGTVYYLKVECGASCNDGLANDMCLTMVGSGSRAIGVACAVNQTDLVFFPNTCGGNECFPPGAITEVPQLDDCLEVTGTDAVVICLDN